MAKASDKASTAWVQLREAKRLVVKAYGDPELAERLLREWFAAETVHWTCRLAANDDETPKPTPAGFIGDPAFWRPIDCGRAGITSVEVNFELGRAWHEIKYQLFVIGPGVPDEPKAPPLPAAWGIEASREELLAQLPADLSRPQSVSTKAWAYPAARRLLEMRLFVREWSSLRSPARLRPRGARPPRLATSASPPRRLTLRTS